MIPVHVVFRLTCEECAIYNSHQPCEACPNWVWRKK